MVWVRRDLKALLVPTPLPWAGMSSARIPIGVTESGAGGEVTKLVWEKQILTWCQLIGSPFGQVLKAVSWGFPGSAHSSTCLGHWFDTGVCASESVFWEFTCLRNLSELLWSFPWTLPCLCIGNWTQLLPARGHWEEGGSTGWHYKWTVQFSGWQIGFWEGAWSPSPTVAVPKPQGAFPFSQCLFAGAVSRAAWISTRDAGRGAGGVVGGMQALFWCFRRFPKPGLCCWGKHPRWDWE